MSRYFDLDDERIVYDRNNGEYAIYCVPLDMQPADVVEVVRCKDCKHGEEKDYVPTKHSRFRWYCKNSANYHSKDFYCSMGEKKGEKDAT